MKSKDKLGTKRYKKNTTRISSFVNSFNGLKYVLLIEPNVAIMIIATIIVVFSGVYFQISRIEFLFTILAIFFVIGSEMVNTAVEVIVDMISPEDNPLAKIAKDVSGGFTLLMVILSVIIGGVIFFPKILEMIR